jgi:hypothetical protein
LKTHRQPGLYSRPDSVIERWVRVNKILNIDRDKQINQLRDQRDRAEKELKEEKVSTKTSFLLCPKGSAT